MAKRKRGINYDKKIKEGFGQGIGIDYKPWLTIQDVSSLGRVTRLKGVKIKRQHEFLSDLERDYFYIVEFSDDILDIREQFALLPLESTIEIANELGIKHPVHLKTKESAPLSTDFFLTIEINKEVHYIARTIKPSDALLDKRTLEKFEIERIYWARNNIDWRIVTDNEMNKTLADNIAFFRE